MSSQRGEFAVLKPTGACGDSCNPERPGGVFMRFMQPAFARCDNIRHPPKPLRNRDSRSVWMPESLGFPNCIRAERKTHSP